MWERATSHSDTRYVNPLELTVRVVNRQTRQFVDVPGDDDGVFDGAGLYQRQCTPQSQDQHWVFDNLNGVLKSSVNPAPCLDGSQTRNNGVPSLRSCDYSGNDTRWVYEDYALRSQRNTCYALDASRRGNNGSGIKKWRFHGRINQDWELRTDLEV